MQAWLAEEVPEYDTGAQVGTRTRARALATNPITVGIAGAAAFLGGEAAAGAAAVRATERAIAAAVQSPIPLREAVVKLPPGMNGRTFGELAGLQRGQAASSGASIEATAEIVAEVQTMPSAVQPGTSNSPRLDHPDRAQRLDFLPQF